MSQVASRVTSIPAMTEFDIQRLLMSGRTTRGQICMPNYTPRGWWECDIFHVTDSGYMREYEVKLTRQDFFRDQDKHTEPLYLGCRHSGWGRSRDYVRKHDLLRSGYECGPKQFWFVVPQGLVALEEVPGHCGLIEVAWRRDRLSIENEKRAPELHKAKVRDQVLGHARGVCVYRYRDLWMARGR